MMTTETEEILKNIAKAIAFVVAGSLEKQKISFPTKYEAIENYDWSLKEGNIIAKLNNYDSKYLIELLETRIFNSVCMINQTYKSLKMTCYSISKYSIYSEKLIALKQSDLLLEVSILKSLTGGSNTILRFYHNNIRKTSNKIKKYESTDR